MLKPLFSTRAVLFALGASVVLSPLSRAAEQEKTDTKPATEQPATTQRTRRAGGAQQFDAMAEKLKLSDDQKKQLQPIVREERGKLNDLRQDTSLSNEERRQKAKEIRDQYLAKVKPILSQEQFDEYKKLREQNAGRGPRGVRRGGDAQTPPSNDSGSSDTKK